MREAEAVGSILRFDVLTEEPGEIDELTRQMFGTGVRVERGDGRPPSLRLAQAALSEIGVQRVTWGMDGRCSVAPLDRFLCIRLHRGAYGLDQGGGRARYGPGDVFLADPDRPVDAEVVAADLDSYTIERPVLEEAARRIAPRSQGRLDFRHAVPVTPALGRTWERVLDHVGSSLREDDLIAENALIRASVLDLLVTTACLAFDLVREEGGERPATARSVRRAVAWIDAHLAEPIAVGDVAAAAGLSARGLQAAFQRVLGTSPHAYIRRARLDAVRRELQRGEVGTTVSAVALHWGFAHLGRFSAAYRDEFGELPSETLRA